VACSEIEQQASGTASTGFVSWFEGGALRVSKSSSFVAERPFWEEDGGGARRTQQFVRGPPPEGIDAYTLGAQGDFRSSGTGWSAWYHFAALGGACRARRRTNPAFGDPRIDRRRPNPVGLDRCNFSNLQVFGFTQLRLREFRTFGASTEVTRPRARNVLSSRRHLPYVGSPRVAFGERPRVWP